MNKNDFRYFRQGKQVDDLKEEDFSLIKSVYHHSEQKERALLLLHGFSSTPAVYRLLIPQLKIMMRLCVHSFLAMAKVLRHFPK